MTKEGDEIEALKARMQVIEKTLLELRQELNEARRHVATEESGSTIDDDNLRVLPEWSAVEFGALVEEALVSRKVGKAYEYMETHYLPGVKQPTPEERERYRRLPLVNNLELGRAMREGKRAVEKYIATHRVPPSTAEDKAERDARRMPFNWAKFEEKVAKDREKQPPDYSRSYVYMMKRQRPPE